MIIANPIYNVTFMRLLENDRAAKFFIGAILGCEVLSLESMAYEHVGPLNVTLFRRDFAAVIVTKEDGEKKVVIEILKVNFMMEVYRYWEISNRKYTASELPIITIYILGFLLSVDSPAFGNVPYYRDLLTNETLVVHDEFVKRLAHSAYFIQTPRIKICLNTPLGKLLSVFEQATFMGGSKMLKDYTFEIDDPEVNALINLLRDMVTDSQVYRKLEKELYYVDAMEDAFGERDRKFAEDKLKKEEALRREAKRQQLETARDLKYVEKMPASKIAKLTKLTEAEIENL